MKPSDYPKPENNKRFYATERFGCYLVYTSGDNGMAIASCPTREHAEMIADALERTAEEEDANAARSLLERRAWEELKDQVDNMKWLFGDEQREMRDAAAAMGITIDDERSPAPEK